ncbi:acyltransferase family protein [Streptomyces sp. SID1121]|uniref:acyltransferase family protein n=1 Tax=Streptomyces sp. SID1121 TaxID=3425888 RepID=UPI0040561F9D
MTELPARDLAEPQPPTGPGTSSAHPAGDPSGSHPAARLDTLTGLRFVAALLVFLYHSFVEVSFVSGNTGLRLGSAMDRGGSYGVGFFFVLSGFVLTWSYRPDTSRGLFLRRRLAKIFPNHLVTLAAAILLAVSTGAALGVSDWLPNLFLLQSWWPDPVVSSSGNPVSWSLSCELLFYLAFPFLLAAIERIPRRLLWPATVAVVGLCAGAALVGRYVISNEPALPYPGFESMSFHQVWFVYWFPPVRMLDFVLGILVARLVLTGQWVRIGMLPALAVAVAGYVVSTYSSYLLGVGGIASVWLVPLIASAATADARGTVSVLRGPVWVRLGELSFAFYMVHYLVLTQLRKALGPEWTSSLGVELLVVLLGLGLSMGLAWILYTLVERPVTVRAGRRRSTTAGAPS